MVSPVLVSLYGVVGGGVVVCVSVGGGGVVVEGVDTVGVVAT